MNDKSFAFDKQNYDTFSFSFELTLWQNFITKNNLKFRSTNLHLFLWCHQIDFNIWHETHVDNIERLICVCLKKSSNLNSRKNLSTTSFAQNKHIFFDVWIKNWQNIDQQIKFMKQTSTRKNEIVNVNVNDDVFFCREVYFKVVINSSFKSNNLNEWIQNRSKSKNKKINKR